MKSLVFSTHLSVFRYLMKHSFLCLISYFKDKQRCWKHSRDFQTKYTSISWIYTQTITNKVINLNQVLGPFNSPHG